MAFDLSYDEIAGAPTTVQYSLLPNVLQWELSKLSPPCQKVYRIGSRQGQYNKTNPVSKGKNGGTPTWSDSNKFDLCPSQPLPALVLSRVARPCHLAENEAPSRRSALAGADESLVCWKKLEEVRSFAANKSE
ncbi:hypothetical protein BaRGS_00028974 [Batillaria attramentaria]|uniref:Uncharacterized protein n=1 Tax=Batillaria attramentaria TaxID=370345 RepID=A0ABD0JXJ9_9CAEN